MKRLRDALSHPTSHVPDTSTPSSDDLRLRRQTPSSILVVDDAPENLLAMTATLSEMADHVATAASGKAALRHLLANDFAVVLLDVSMPDLDGYETARIIRSHERFRNVPIIFLTAFDRNEEDVLRAYELGAVDFLFKPIQLEVLRAKVAVFVELQRRASEVARQANRLRELERRDHERALEAQRAEDDRKLAQHLAEMDRRKDEFLAMLGHELRTPLAAMSAARLLVHDSNLDEIIRRRASRTIQRQIHHLIRLVDDLLDVSRVRSGRIELKNQRTRLDHVIERAVELATPALEDRRHALTVSPDIVPVALDVDPVRIIQAISNLLHNAARYTPQCGAIEIGTRRIGDRVSIVVEDNGVGLEPEALEQVFDMFVQVVPGREGLGLGLPLAKHLIELHGGTLVAQSDGPGRGARFEIMLPIAAEVSAVDRESSTPLTLPPPPNRTGPEPVRVLIIEDDEDLRATLCDLLASWGHPVTSASTGRAGLARLLEAPPDVALIDIGLPDIDGCEVAATARARLGASERLIALTGYVQESDRERVLWSGFDDYLTKPPDLELLRELLSNAKPR